MDERRLSELQKEYRAFFLGKMQLYGVMSPAELTKEGKSAFFTEIKLDWAKHKSAKKEKRKSIQRDLQTHTKNSKSFNKVTQTEPRKHTSSQPYAVSPQEAITEIIKSEPNKEQTDELRILYRPNEYFQQPGPYTYPVVKMPIKKSILKLPRAGRSNQKGYKEDDFFNLLKLNLVGVEITNEVHMVIPNFGKPYEPDIVMFDPTLNLYLDIEIDEPYDGYYRYPTHFIDPEDEVKRDDIRDLFFTESGWIVIRFTEKQVHCEPGGCIEYIHQVLSSIYARGRRKDIICERENQWDYNQCIQWQKANYRETYLGIDRFHKRRNVRIIQTDISGEEAIEKVIQRTKQFHFANWNSSIAFDEEAHRYIHRKDESGNAEYLSVTTLIERFFPFDLKRYVERKALEEQRQEEDVLLEYLAIRDEAAEKGTYLHSQIEAFLMGNQFDADSKEFNLFLSFYNKEIRGRNLVFSDAEKIVASDKHGVAGTIDCLFKKPNSDEYVMLDWKRSKKLVVDGHPRMYGFGSALSELGSLDNSSYNRYCLQQNIYKFILETEYQMRISSMKLIVLHEMYSDYYVVPVPEMSKETKLILNSLHFKI